MLVASVALASISPLRAPPLAFSTTTRPVLLRTPPPACLAAKKSGKAGKKKAAAAAAAPKGFGARPPAAPAKELVPLTAEQTEWRAFERWLTSHGATLDAIELADCNGIRGVRATRSLKAGEEVLRIPRAVILDEDAADASPVGALWGGAAREVVLPPHLRLALLLLHEQRRGEESDACEYLRMLPSAEDFAEQGGPASLWSEAELEACGCAKLTADAAHKRRSLQADLDQLSLASRWREIGLPGAPPTLEEAAWAVAAVTSRAYGAAVTAEAPPQSMLIPMVDMANHVHPGHTAKGLSEDGKHFLVVAREPIKKGQQVHLSYGPLPNLTLLLQFGFVLDPNPSDFALVDCSLLQQRPEAAEAAAERGLLMRERNGKVSEWQPAGDALRAALLQLAAEGALPDAGSSADAAAQASAADAAYAALLRATLDASSGGSVAEDREALESEGLAPRHRLALQFRAAQKARLNAELSSAGTLKKVML